MNRQWAMILGGGDCVWDDVARWELLYGKPWDGLVIAANDVGAHWPRELHHWVSLHPLKFARWRALRIVNDHPGTFTTWGKEQFLPKTVCDQQLTPWPGSTSGLFAIQVAKLLRCTRVVLCGVPMTPTPHFAESRESFGIKWEQASVHWRPWVREKQRLLGWVRSMSGQTSEMLGVPTLDWLLGE